MAKLRHSAHATKRRSLAKAGSWRLVAAVDTLVISYLITGQATWAFSIATVEAITKIVIYYVHERGWAHIRWGVHKPD
ncbi:MAG: DUF2061 domain-containing protein [Alphaproteobacteria bacterium]